MTQTEILVNNRTGLHARPAKLFTTEAKKFKCSITIEKNGGDGQKCNAKSIFSVLAMGADKGTSLKLTADGEDEKEALQALQRLAENDFGETEESI